MVYVFSDPHFYSERIIQVANRPFHSVEEMNETIIKNYNMIVQKQDVCYWLGDIMYDASKEKVREILGRMHGRKYLIRGNHDMNHSETWWRAAGFDKVFSHPIYDTENHAILSHEPLPEFGNVPGIVNYHGHIHINGYDFNNHQNCINACVEMTGYKPVPLINPLLLQKQNTR